jgi:hypothetical protein
VPKRKTIPFQRDREKESWSLYGLQGLQPDRFARVVKKIIDGDYLVVRPATRPSMSA